MIILYFSNSFFYVLFHYHLVEFIVVQAIFSYFKLSYLLYCRQDNLIPSIRCGNPAADIFHWPSDPSSWESLEKPKASLEVSPACYQNMSVSSHKLAFQCSSQLHWHSFASRSLQHLLSCVVATAPLDSHSLPMSYTISPLWDPSLKAVQLLPHGCEVQQEA